MLAQDLMRTAWESLRAHSLRTVLSVLGIVIGIASFSLMYSVGETARQKTLTAIKALGGDIFRVTAPQEDLKNPAQAIFFTMQDVSAIQKTCPTILDVSPELDASLEYFKAGVLKQHRIVAVLPSYLKMNRIKVSRGRLFSELDIDYGLQVCLVGRAVAADMFPGMDPLAQLIPVNGYLFQVLGVLTDTPNSSTEALKDSVIIPLPAALKLFPANKTTTLHLRGINTNTAMAEIKQFLFRRFGETVSFDIQSQRLVLKAQQQSLRIFEYVLWAIGSISLLVGGIGIMNIMLVSVTERVREIGIRRAVGATRLEIKMQFLCEAMLLCVLGGLGGTLIGFAGAHLISRLFGFSPIFSLKLLVVAITTASALGLICGTYPAVRAANQDPTIVLRYD